MVKKDIVNCFINYPFILTEGAVGQRIEREFGIRPDSDVIYAGLIYDDKSRAALEYIYRQYLQIAQDYDIPILLMTNTRRANKERVQRSAYKEKQIIGDYSSFLRSLTTGYHCTSFIGGMMGCKNNAYSGKEGLTVEEAEKFHSWQAEAFIMADIDYLFAGIMPSLDETSGMAKVMERTGLPYIISLMIGPDGKLLDGHPIHHAIERIDACVSCIPLCYMTNCVHPAILREALTQPFNLTDLVRRRFMGIQANAACLSPDKLDMGNKLETTSPTKLADEFELLHRDFPLKIYGGCCGTDNTHIVELAKRIKAWTVKA